MSMASSLSNALSGLTAASRAAELVSSNVANAMTEGYARRELVLSSRTLGGVGQGVLVRGVTRDVDVALLADRRVAYAGLADREVRSGFLARLESALGTPESPDSIGARIAALDSSLIEAVSRPESEARLSNIVGAAKSLAAQIGNAASNIQTTRAEADDQIDTDVEKVNTSLVQIADLNAQIRAFTGAGRDTSSLMDQRQQLVDQISDILPMREIDRGHGQIALYTTSGAALLDGLPSKLGFSSVGMITPDMTLASGALSGLTINDRPVQTSGSYSPIAGGRLAANFAVRDELAPAAQTRLDTLARDLVERFADPALDPTRAPGDPGLFTDAGGAFSPTDETGLAQRLAVNTAVDPANGGALWRLRDGLGAATPGPIGNSSLLTSLQSALTQQRAPSSGGFVGGTYSLSSLNAAIVSGASGARLTAEAETSFATARAETLKTMELRNGVDTDQEMQKLLMIEQAYAANAKVVQAVDGMIQTLLEM